MATAFFKILLKVTQIRYFWPEISRFLALHETLHFDKLECADLLCVYNFLQLLLETSIGGSLSPRFKDF